MAALAEGPAAKLFIKTENFDGQELELQVATLRPNTVTEQVKLGECAEVQREGEKGGRGGGVCGGVMGGLDCSP